MELKDFVIKPCKARLAFEFVPKQNKFLELESIAQILKKNRVELEVQTPYLLVLRVQDHGATVFKSGKIYSEALLKNANG